MKTRTVEWGVMLNNGEVVEMPSPDPEVGRRAARSMVTAINNGAYPGQSHAVVVARDVVIEKQVWRVV